jgi:hypothetical protein
LKFIVLAWCPEDDNVTHKYSVEMRRLACDETPFLTIVQLGAITLSWWPDDGNVILIDTYDHDRLARNETSYTSSNPLIILFTLVGPPFLIAKRFISFLGDHWVKHLKCVYIGSYLFPYRNPFGPSSPSSHRMRGNPFLGQYTLKSKEIRKWGV